MSNTIRIKRRANGGGAGAPASLANAELAFNEQTNILYYGTGTGGSGGSATSIIPIAGSGAFVDTSSTQTIGGDKTFSNTVNADISGNAATATSADTATTADEAIALQTGRTISITGDIAYTSDAFDGTANVTGTGTLATVNSNVGTYTKVTINAKGLATAGEDAHLNDLAAATGNYSMGDFSITDLADPVAATDAANKQYVDSVAQGLNVKAAVHAATTGNITLSGLTTQTGGDWTSSLTAGDRILVKDQTAPAENGIYVASSTSWSRSADADTWAELVSAFTFIQTGATLADSGWVCTVNAGGTLGVTAVTWVQFSSAGSYIAGTGLTLTGNEFSITDTAVTADTYGAASETLTITVNAQGQLTAASAQSIAISNSQVSGLGTMSTQDASNVNITGGSIQDLTTFNGITIDGGTF